MLENILMIIAGLAGLGAFVSILISVLKKIGVIKDGQSEQWYQGISLFVFLAVTVVYFLKVPIVWSDVNEWLKLLTFILGYVIQILGGQLTYNTIKGTPLLGFSYEKNQQRAAAKLNAGKEPVK
jgi:uncharacterized membrane protein